MSEDRLRKATIDLAGLVAEHELDMYDLAFVFHSVCQQFGMALEDETASPSVKAFANYFHHHSTITLAYSKECNVADSAGAMVINNVEANKEMFKFLKPRSRNMRKLMESFKDTQTNISKEG